MTTGRRATRRTLVLLGMLFVCPRCPEAAGEEAGTLSLPALVELARSENPEIRAALLEYRMAYAEQLGDLARARRSDHSSGNRRSTGGKSPVSESPEQILRRVPDTRSVYAERELGGFFVDFIPDRGAMHATGSTSWT
jgi:hypothetical protein